MEKTPLVLLPGLLCDETVWQPQLAEFGSGRQVLVGEFRGFSSFDDMAVSVLSRAPPRFALVGHSMGGRVALEMMRHAPERIDRLALLSTGVHPVLPGEAEKRQELIELAWRDGIAVLAHNWLPAVLHPSRRADAAFVELLETMWRRSTPAIHEGQIRAALNRLDARPILPNISCPTLVLGGADDPWSPTQQQREIAAAIAGAQLTIIPDCGHMVTLECPAATNEALGQWLAQDPCPYVSRERSR